MTTIDDQTQASAEVARREADRLELATIVERDPETLTDTARLADDLGLDSLAMMSLLAWLETRGVTLATRSRPATVADVLALLDTASFRGLSVRFTDTAARPARPNDFSLVRPAGSELAPTLSNNEIRLTPVEPDDLRFLYALSIHPETCFRWRYRGAPPPIERFASDLWSQVLVQFVARRTDDGEPVGHVVAYGADMGQRYAYIGAVFRAEYHGSGLAAQVVAMFVRYMFHAFPMRKLYVEIPGFNWPQMRSGEGKIFQVEGIMRDHEFFGGRYWDRYLCAIYPDAVGGDPTP